MVILTLSGATTFQRHFAAVSYGSEGWSNRYYDLNVKVVEAPAFQITWFGAFCKE